MSSFAYEGTAFANGLTGAWNAVTAPDIIGNSSQNQFFNDNAVSFDNTGGTKRQYEYYSWWLNNWYNSPAQQVERLKSAGLNPSLALSGNSSGLSSSGPNSGSDGPTLQKILQFIPQAVGIMQTMQAIQNQQAQKRVLDAQEQQIKSQTAKNDFYTDYLGGIIAENYVSKTNLNKSASYLNSERASSVMEDIFGKHIENQIADMMYKSLYTDSSGNPIDPYINPTIQAQKKSFLDSLKFNALRNANVKASTRNYNSQVNYRKGLLSNLADRLNLDRQQFYFNKNHSMTSLLFNQGNVFSRNALTRQDLDDRNYRFNMGLLGSILQNVLKLSGVGMPSTGGYPMPNYYTNF